MPLGNNFSAVVVRESGRFHLGSLGGEYRLPAFAGMMEKRESKKKLCAPSFFAATAASTISI
jgi:hypothetical protein